MCFSAKQGGPHNFTPLFPIPIATTTKGADRMNKMRGKTLAPVVMIHLNEVQVYNDLVKLATEKHDRKQTPQMVVKRKGNPLNFRESAGW